MKLQKTGIPSLRKTTENSKRGMDFKVKILNKRVAFLNQKTSIRRGIRKQGYPTQQRPLNIQRERRTLKSKF